MTEPGAGELSAGLVDVPRRVLDADGLDRLELVLGGWLPASALPADAFAPGGAREVVLTDAQNTPLAHVVAGPGAHDLPAVRPLAPLARGAGPHWDPAVRLDAGGLRSRLGEHARGVTAIVVDAVPTYRAAEMVATAYAGVPVVVVVAPARTPRPAGEVGWAGLTRAAWAMADWIESAVPGSQVVRLVVPWPSDRHPEFELAGIDAWVMLSELGRPEDEARIADLGMQVEHELAAVYPPASARELLRAHREGSRRGAVVLFTGLSGSGKSTIARALADELEDDGRRVTLLDGDEVRQHLSPELGFDAASRERNVERIGWVAAEVARHGGIVIAAPIAPFAASRARVRAMAEPHGPFLLVWVSTPLDVCEARDRKGMYARARAGEVADFTGISSPYEDPDDADLVLDTSSTGVEQAVTSIRALLEERLGG
jgi:sulfate adenylyltransferase